MEIDALLLLARILKDFRYTDTDFLIMQSYIVNRNIDINLSIRGNACLFLEENQLSLDECKNIRDIALDSSEYTNVPIYKLLIQNLKLRNFVIQALAKKVLNDTSILDVVETTLLRIDTLDVIEEQSDLIRFLMDFLAKKRFTRKNNMQESKIINEYVKRNENTVFYEKKENDRFLDGYQSRFFRRMLLYKLFSCGYASFDYNQKLNLESIDSGIVSIVTPLVETRSYGHLRLMINMATLSDENIEELKIVVKKVFKSLYNGEVSKDEAESDVIFIEKLNVFLKSVNSELLDYDEISKSEIGIKL